MFSVLFDRKQKVLMVRLGSSFDPATMAALNAALQKAVKAEGTVHGIIDFSAVESGTIPPDKLIEEAREKPIVLTGQRVYVAPTDNIFANARMFATHQLLATGNEPMVVRTLPAAYAALGLKDPDFQPL